MLFNKVATCLLTKIKINFFNFKEKTIHDLRYINIKQQDIIIIGICTSICNAIKTFRFEHFSNNLSKDIISSFIARSDMVRKCSIYIGPDCLFTLLWTRFFNIYQVSLLGTEEINYS